MIRVVAEECAKPDFVDKVAHVGPGGAAVLIVLIIAIAAVLIASFL